MRDVRKIALLAAALVLVVSLAACGGGTPAPSGGGSSAGGREIKVTATDFKFDPANYTFKSGEKIKITMTNRGAVDHTWILADTSNKELFKMEVKVGKTGSFEFTAPAAGAYKVICDIAGHKEAGMEGKASIQ